MTVVELIVSLKVSPIVQIRIDDGMNPDYYHSVYDLART